MSQSRILPAKEKNLFTVNRKKTHKKNNTQPKQNGTTLRNSFDLGIERYWCLLPSDYKSPRKLQQADDNLDNNCPKTECDYYGSNPFKSLTLCHKSMSMKLYNMLAFNYEFLHSAKIPDGKNTVTFNNRVSSHTSTLHSNHKLQHTLTIWFSLNFYLDHLIVSKSCHWCLPSFVQVIKLQVPGHPAWLCLTSLISLNSILKQHLQ